MKRNNSTRTWINKDIENLFSAILKVRNTEECQRFFRDLMSIKEIEIFALRLKVANMLNQGYTYKEIERKTGMSSTTIARISRWLEYGENGYKLILNRLNRKTR